MWLPTLLLPMLVSMVTARHDGRDVGTYQADAVTNILEGHGYPITLEVHRRFIDRHRREGHRHKRTINTFFYNWLRIVRTTIGVERYRLDNLEAKIFFKVGSLDDAVSDFYSLNPTSIGREGEILTGKVGNQVIVIDSSDRVPVLNVESSHDAKHYKVINRNKVTRSIMYFDNAKEAEIVLRRLKDHPRNEMDR